MAVLPCCRLNLDDAIGIPRKGKSLPRLAQARGRVDGVVCGCYVFLFFGTGGDEEI